MYPFPGIYINSWICSKSVKVLLRLVTGGAGGKGLGAFKQFRPSLDLVSAELLTRAAKMVPQQDIFWLVVSAQPI